MSASVIIGLSSQLRFFQGERCNVTLGGDRSIQLSYGGLYRKYSILQGSRIRTIRFLGGERSILLSYRDIYSIFGLFPGFLELQPVLRRLRRAVLLIKKRSIFDRFISSIRVIDPSAIVRREIGTVASGVISQEDLNSQQIYCFSADSCSPFFLGGECSIP